MKIRYFFLIFILLLIIPLCFAENPSEIKINNLVNDYADIFTAQEEASLNNLLLDIYNSKIAEYSIVTIKSLDGYDSQAFAQEISNNNLGDETNNGLLLLIAVEDHKYWFNVGRGLEPIFNDAKIGRIGREQLVPYFKQNQYYKGTISASSQIANELNINSTNKVTTTTPQNQIYFNPIWIFIIIMIIMTILRSISAKNQKGKKGKNHDNLFLAAILASSMMRGGRGGFNGGGGSFGGFGGGGFGGGGAGGGW